MRIWDWDDNNVTETAITKVMNIIIHGYRELAVQI